jgi:hypothetical protein
MGGICNTHTNLLMVNLKRGACLGDSCTRKSNIKMYIIVVCTGLIWLGINSTLETLLVW